jgi:hypothetical protein
VSLLIHPRPLLLLLLFLLLLFRLRPLLLLCEARL